MKTKKEIMVGQSFTYAGAFHTIIKIQNDTVFTDVLERLHNCVWAKKTVEMIINNPKKYE